MLKLFSIFIAILAAVIAWLTEMTWLYIAAFGFLVISAAVFVGKKSRGFSLDRKATRSSVENAVSPEDELRSLGISDIRPRAKGAGRVPSEANVESPPANRPSIQEGYPNKAKRETETPTLFDPPRERQGYPPGIAEAAGMNPRRDFEAVLTPYLQAAQATCKAHTACFLEIDEDQNQYRVTGASSKSGYVRRRGRIGREGHFLTRMSHDAPVKVIRVDDSSFEVADLGYYSTTVGVSHIAVAPVRTSLGIVGHLVIDTLGEDGEISASSQRIIQRFSELLGLILDQLQPNGQSDGTKKHDEKDRPRREIIQEEMDRARAKEKSLALALVYLDREGAGEPGEDSSASVAESDLSKQLEEMTPGGRVERFGELMFGVFHYGNTSKIEEWAHRVQETIESAEGDAPKGSISIGVAVFGDRHETPDDLRADAADALRAAYETGDCIIVE